jgi:hypothetical protein
MKYTDITADGIRFALPSLLLADKLRTYSERGVHGDTKRANDLTDIEYTLALMARRGDVMPEDLKQMIATDRVIRNFWGRISDDDKVALFGPLTRVGIAIPQ